MTKAAAVRDKPRHPHQREEVVHRHRRTAGGCRGTGYTKTHDEIAEEEEDDDEESRRGRNQKNK